MADTLKYQEPASGSQVSTDELSIDAVTQHVQRVKIAAGKNGTYQEDLYFGDGPVGSAIPVTQATRPMYQASCGTGVITMTATPGAVTSIGYLWHPSSSSKRVSIKKIIVSFSVPTPGNGEFVVNVARITAENGTPGGTSQTINPQDQADPASACTFRTGAAAPTRAAGDLVAVGFSTNANGQITLDETFSGKGLVCRASTAEGYEVRVSALGLLSGVPKVGTTFIWAEE